MQENPSTSGRVLCVSIHSPMSDTSSRPTWELPLKALASYMNQVEGLSRDWVEDGLCRQFPVGQRGDGFPDWTADYYDTHRTKAERASTERAKMALMVCANCSVQFSCASYGAKSGAVAGIYGVRSTSLAWLRRYGGGSLLDKLMDEGRASGLSVEVFVARKRHLTA